MTHTDTWLDTESRTPMDPAQEWLDELAGLDPRSHEYQTLATTLGELGISAPDQAERNDTGELESPAGFVSMRKVSGSRLPVGQFEGRIATLKSDSEYIEPETFELTTDTGAQLRVSDLRPFMVNKTSKLVPKTEAEQRKLDTSFWRDMKIYAETGQSRNTATDIEGIGYARANGTAMRTYFTPAEDQTNTNHVRQVARLLDCGDSKSYEDRLYREAFGRKVHK